MGSCSSTTSTQTKPQSPKPGSNHEAPQQKTITPEPQIVPQKQAVEGGDDATLPPPQTDNKHIENHTEPSPKEPEPEKDEEKKDEEKPAEDAEPAETRTEEPVAIETAPKEKPAEESPEVVEQPEADKLEEPAKDDTQGEMGGDTGEGGAE